MNFWNPQNPIDHPCCYCLYHVLKWKSLSRVWVFGTPWTIQSMEFSRPEYSVGSCFLLQGIFPIQGSNPGLPHCRQILYQLSHKASRRILDWVAYPFSSGSSWPRNWTGVPALQVDSLPTELPGKPMWAQWHLSMWHEILTSSFLKSHRKTWNWIRC